VVENGHQDRPIGAHRKVLQEEVRRKLAIGPMPAGAVVVMVVFFLVVMI